MKICEKLYFDVLIHLWIFYWNPLGNDNFKFLLLKIYVSYTNATMKILLKSLEKWLSYHDFNFVTPENMCVVHKWWFVKSSVLTSYCISENFVGIRWEMTELWPFPFLPLKICVSYTKENLWKVAFWHCNVSLKFFLKSVEKWLS